MMIRVNVIPQPIITIEVTPTGGGGQMPEYEGEYDVTPSRETQILPTAGKAMAQDVTVHPIPPNYGLITYNGFEITVS